MGYLCPQHTPCALHAPSALRAGVAGSPQERGSSRAGTGGESEVGTRVRGAQAGRQALGGVFILPSLRLSLQTRTEQVDLELKGGGGVTGGLPGHTAWAQALAWQPGTLWLQRGWGHSTNPPLSPTTCPQWWRGANTVPCRHSCSGPG